MDRLEGKETKGTKAQRKWRQGHAWGREEAGAQLEHSMHQGGREPKGLEAGWEKTRHKIGCRWAGLGPVRNGSQAQKENWGWSQ